MKKYYVRKLNNKSWWHIYASPWYYEISSCNKLGTGKGVRDE